MSSFLSESLILAWVVISVFAIGLAICHRFFPLRGIELLGYGAAIGVVAHGVVGLWVAMFWHARHFLVFILPIGAVVAIVYLLRRRVFSELASTLNRATRFALLLWLLFIFACIAVVNVDVTWPANLPDGLYVFKKHRQNVKVQYLCTLTADNYIPYVAEEFFLRNISFKKQRPILPAQEVSNRTVLMSLVAVPFRAVFDWKNPGSKKLGVFNYAGKDWPNVERLNDNNSFEQFLPIGIFLNALLLLGLLVLFSNLEPASSLVAPVLLFATNPYCVIQTIFTWPKAFFGFFLLLAWNSIRRGHRPAVVGICAALAYHAHPASVAAIVSLGCWYAWQALRKRTSWRSVIEYGGVIFLALLPWIFWTQFVLRIPANLFEQNFAREGMDAAMSSAVNFFSIRALNTFNALSPMIFTVYPFRLDAFVNYTTICLPTAVGLLLIPFAILECVRLARRETVLIWFGLTIPAAVILLIFSYPALPVFHGWQVLVGALIFLGAMRMRRVFSKRTFIVLFALQLACNLAFVCMRASLVGAHF